MNNISISFIITSLAGLSTLIGTFMIFFKNKDSIISSSLSFTSGVIISICLFDLIPNSFNKIHERFLFIPTILYILIFLCLGVIIDLIIEKLIKYDNKLYKIGILSMISLMIHNIPEGIITFVASSTNISFGITLSIAIALHNIPEGILISIPIYYSSKSRFKAFLYTFIGGMSELLGGIFGYMFFNNISTNYILGFIYSLISGLMLYIAIYEIPITLKEYNKKGRGIFFIIGIIIILLTHLFLN